MDVRQSLVVGCVLVFMLCAVPAVSTADAGTETTVQEIRPAEDSLPQTSSSDEISVTTTLDRTPETVGEMTVTVAVEIPDRVTELTAIIPDRARVSGTDGFSAVSDTDYEWDSETTRPTVTYRVDPNRLSDREGPLSVDGQYLFADTDDWALVRIPHTGISGRYTGSRPITLDQETDIDGPGAAGERMAFLGPVDVRTTRAHGQRFRLIIPDAADLEASPSEIFDSVTHASDRLRVGDRDETVTMIAAPTGEVGWTVRGLQIGDADLWVRDSEGLATPPNVWLHEYVHTRQGYTTDEDFRWFTEGSATYYAALLSLQQDRTDFESFRRFLRSGEGRPQASATLSEPDSWENFAEYRKGALVAGEIDRQIRRETDREATLDTVFREVNAETEPVSARTFRSGVRDAAGSEVGDAANRYTTTTAVPSMWDGDAHAAAFDQSPARFSYRLAETDPIRVSGPERDTSLSGPDLALVAGETLRIRMAVENVGGTVGDYELAFRVDDTEQPRSGRLRAGEQVIETFEYTFTNPGEYTVAVGNEQFAVAVAPADSDDGETGTVDTEPPEPLEDTVEGTTDDGEQAEEEKENETATDESDVSAPGFGVVPALIALVLVAGGYRRRRRT
ncbi:hypothetical protein EGH24_07030 [Halonotius terrestris]|uniref:PGF-CTERM protein n=1 Tax=Halonotius terrestris TaxID=2487750 RepID=A0A8J8TCF4_9EURY|nr:hypothetical protein [Halonotius terrestris]TQQ80904.1 hypothetical protein EGH24_07030 [Halonotius terrestris]